ncbi:MAG: GAF domain-containing protein [Chloroflexota bacterium]
MKFTTETYLDLLNQLRLVAINSKSIEQRHRMRDNMMRLAVRVFDATSAYLCKHDFEQQVSIVLNDYISSPQSKIATGFDVDNIYPEGDMPHHTAWLYSDEPQPYILKPTELDSNGAEYAEYAPHNVMSVIFAPIHYDASLWGYLEIWDSKRERTYTEKQFERLSKIASAISDSILTNEG